ncbi:MAG: asparagine synthase-related protein [Pseudomonadota bacterium]|nr:asparagine synthase-related protein [Pseudomonadota bacterium]
MTALAGAVGVSDAGSAEAMCRASLFALSSYGRRSPSIRAIAGAAFGISLFELLPEDGFDRQPLGDRRSLFVADVRLDNRADLIRMLGERIEGLTDKADSEVLFLALLNWGEQALDRIVGDFAFAWFDARTNKLILARDPLGNRPLFYARSGESIRFASMPSGVVTDARLGVDIEAVAARLSLLRLGSGRTIFDQIRCVDPGHVVTIEGSRESARSYWQPAPRFDTRTTDELIGAFREHLDVAVSSCMRSNSPVIATQLSSGYDSNAVTATAARMVGARERMIAFTSAPMVGLPQLVSPNRIADESQGAALAAKSYGIRHEIVRDPTPLLSLLGEATRSQQQPFRNHFNMGWWTETMRAASEKGASAMLIATMGNFTISYGGPMLLPYLVRRGRPGRWWREARAAVDKNDNRWRGILMKSFGPWLPDSATQLLQRLFVGAPPPTQFAFLRPHWIERLADWEPGATYPRFSGDYFADRLAWMQVYDPGMLNKGLLAQTGVEQRDASADRRLIEFCLSLPVQQLLRDGDYKPLARKALADRVPRTILDAPLRGYQGSDWNARFAPAHAHALIDEIAASAGASDLLDIGKLRNAVERWPQSTTSSYETMHAFGRNLIGALSAGYFIAQVERDPSALGR